MVVHYRKGSCHFNNMTGVLNGRLPEFGHAVTSRIVFFFHQKVERTITGQQPDGHPALEAFLGAVAMDITMFADLEVTGVVNDLTHHGCGLAFQGFPIHRGGNRSCAPGLGRLLTERGMGLIKAPRLD